MNNLSLFRFWSIVFLSILLPLFATARFKKTYSEFHKQSTSLQLADTTIKKQPEKTDSKKPDSKLDEKDGKGNKPEIKSVPKSKPQVKPAAVKSRIKIKTPIKKPVIKRPVIKRPVGLIKGKFGL